METPQTILQAKMRRMESRLAMMEDDLAISKKKINESLIIIYIAVTVALSIQLLEARQ